MESFFRSVIDQLSAGHVEEAGALPRTHPGKFNWYRSVLQDIHLQDRPGATALIWTDGADEQRFTYAELDERTDRLLGHVRSAGISTGDVLYTQIALVPAIWDAHLTAIKGGLRLIPAAVGLAQADIVYRFRTLLPKVVLANERTAAVIDAALHELGADVPVKLLVGGERAGWTAYAEIIAQPGVPQATVDSHADDPLFCFFTSGTTGLPKVVVHTQLSYPLGHLTTASWIGLRAGDLHYNISQPGWAKFAWSCFFAPLTMGATVLAYDPPGRFDAQAQLALLERYRVNTFCAPPTALRLLVQEDLRAFNFRLRECVAAGEPLNPEVIEAWRQGTGHTLRDGYGQTETTCLVANLPGTTIKPGSMGKPTFLYTIIIADDAGNELADNEEGTICIRTGTGRPNGVFHHYLDAEDKMEAVFKNELYYTGDKAYRDSDGYIWFVGRDDDVIKASDYRVGPFEVESVLLEHEAVLESAVVGSPDPLRGHTVKAFVVLAPGAIPSAELAAALYSYVRARMASYKLPRIISFVSELPKTISGKIRRVELRAQEADRKARGVVEQHEYFPH